MKNKYSILFLSFLVHFVSHINAQVGIGTTTPHTSSILDVKSTNKGFLPPRLTKVQMDNINNPAEGLVIFCKDCCPNLSFGQLAFHNGTEWKYIPQCDQNNPNILPNADFDGDGIPNWEDIDDDNDGILDVEEFGSNSQVFNTSLPSNHPNYETNPSTVTIQQAKPQEATIEFDFIDQSFSLNVNGTPLSSTQSIFELQYNQSNSLVFSDNNSVMSQPWLASSQPNTPRVILHINALGEVSIKATKTVSSQTYVSLIPKDGSSYNTFSFIDGNNTFVLTNEDGHGGDKIAGKLDVKYAEDTDGDGIPNNFDTDSDDDECTDSYEGGLTSDTDANFTFDNNNVGTNGLDNSLEQTPDNGVVNYPAINLSVAVLNSAVNLCTNGVPTASNLNISGTVSAGQTLTASYTFADPDGDSENGSVIQWYRANDNSGTGETAIPGANSLTYVTNIADANKYLRFSVTPKDQFGKTGTLVYSPYTSQEVDGIDLTNIYNTSSVHHISSPSVLAKIFNNNTNDDVSQGEHRFHPGDYIRANVGSLPANYKVRLYWRLGDSNTRTVYMKFSLNGNDVGSTTDDTKSSTSSNPFVFERTIPSNIDRIEIGHDPSSNAGKDVLFIELQIIDPSGNVVPWNL